MTIEQLIVASLCASSIIRNTSDEPTPYGMTSEEAIAEDIKKQSDAILEKFNWDKDLEILHDINLDLAKELLEVKYAVSNSNGQTGNSATGI